MDQDFRRRTKAGERIKAAFLDALMEKGLRDLNVKDLCHAAGVNRSTFYDNFASMQDLLREVQLDYFKDIFAILPPDAMPWAPRTDEERLDTLRIAIKYHVAHRDVLFALLDNNSAGEFETNISIFLKKEILPPDYTKLEEFEFIYHFMGTLITTVTWLREGQPFDEETFAHFLARI